MSALAADDAVAFFREHAGYSYDPRTESPAQGRERSARALAESENAYRDDCGVFVVWEHDDVGSCSNFDDVDRSDCEPYAFYTALLCVETVGKSDVLVWDDRSFCERSGRVVASLGAIDLGEFGNPYTDPYARVIVAEMYTEFECTRERAIVRGEN